IHLCCQNNASEIGIVTTTGSVVTLTHVTGASNNTDVISRLVITSFKASADCNGFKCANSRCISQDLACDGINHCGDNSDESSDAKCQH
ncbi:uncharacterized protein B4U80_02771, partial [Leptotrombidium deliense]